MRDSPAFTLNPLSALKEKIVLAFVIIIAGRTARVVSKKLLRFIRFI
jgi:hypothetical protein